MRPKSYYVLCAWRWLSDSQRCRVAGRGAERHVYSFDIACYFTRLAIEAHLSPQPGSQRELFV